jgi:hypothetical protein
LGVEVVQPRGGGGGGGDIREGGEATSSPNWTPSNADPQYPTPHFSLTGDSPQSVFPQIEQILKVAGMGGNRRAVFQINSFPESCGYGR